jgi:hypothetical protein
VTLTFGGLVARLPGRVRVNRAGTEARTNCPVHGGNRGDTLAIYNAPLRVKCFKGCPTHAILAALSLTRADLGRDPATPYVPAEPELVTAAVVNSHGDGTDPVPGGQHTTGALDGFTHTHSYRYLNAEGLLVGVVDRFEQYGRDGVRIAKTFRQRVPDLDAPGGWNHSLSGRVLPLYGLPELLHRPEGAPVMACEGEKDVERARVTYPGWTVTSNPSGAKGWRRVHTHQLLGATQAERDTPILLSPDPDPAGAEWLATLRRELGNRRRIEVLRVGALAA